MESYITELKGLKACQEAIAWLEEGKYKTLNDAWQVCERGDWMLWLVGTLSGELGSDKRKKLVLTACQCARLALPYVTKDDTRPLKAIEMAEAWANGDPGISLSDLRTAAHAAAYTAVYTAVYTANAAYAAVYAANAANAATQSQCADIVRQYYPTAPKLTLRG